METVSKTKVNWPCRAASKADPCHTNTQTTTTTSPGEKGELLKMKRNNTNLFLGSGGWKIQYQCTTEYGLWWGPLCLSFISHYFTVSSYSEGDNLVLQGPFVPTPIHDLITAFCPLGSLSHRGPGIWGKPLCIHICNPEMWEGSSYPGQPLTNGGQSQKIKAHHFCSPGSQVWYSIGPGQYPHKDTQLSLVVPSWSPPAA